MNARLAAVGCVLVPGSAGCSGGALPLAPRFPWASKAESQAMLDTAFRECRDAVEQRLKAPASAAFPAEETTVRLADEGDVDWRYEVHGAVDAQNGFGAMIRLDYECDAVFGTSSRTWTASGVALYE
ncbi:MAG: hypothetical protein M0026_06495 [Nocardiopsaceae bacterium]|nr:hypothetical protein [Nocardiopsaceae bacterium]